ncbi:MAG: sulfatase [Aureliella sp.]
MNTARTSLRCMILLVSTMLLPSTVVAAERPNVLFVFLDDYGWRDCGYMGSDFYETPTIDRLAKSGMVFTDAYAAAANCAPSRACLLSGQYTPRHEIYNVGTGLRGNPKHSKLKHVPGTDTLTTDITTWAQLAQSAGYRTGTIGKWHLSNDPIPYGFDFNFAGSHSGSPPRGYYAPHPGAPGLKDAPKDEYLTDRLSEEAANFIERNKERPWLLYLTHFAVHTPLQGRPDLVSKYDAKEPGELHNHPVMAAMIESVDNGLKQVVDTLDRLKLTDNTIIIFTSDNGGYGPATNMDPLKGYKGTYYEGGIRVPMFVSWPGRTKPGSRCSVPVSNVDIFPTICEMIGAEMPGEQVQDGQSLLPLLDGKTPGKDRSLYWHFPAYLQGYSRADEQRDPIFRTRPCSVVRHGNWKLHEYFEDRMVASEVDKNPLVGLELYDLSVDVSESKNLVESHPEKASELLRRLHRWQEQTNAPIPTTPNPAYDPAAEEKELTRQSKKGVNRKNAKRKR